MGIYGENRGDVDKFDEAYLGYIDCNTTRAGYLEGKRLGESLCNAFASQRSLKKCGQQGRVKRGACGLLNSELAPLLEKAFIICLYDNIFVLTSS